MFSKIKFLLLSMFVLGASVANAAITVDNATGVISGEIDKAPFFSGAAVVIVALGAFWAVRKVIGLFSR